MTSEDVGFKKAAQDVVAEQPRVDDQANAKKVRQTEDTGVWSTLATTAFWFRKPNSIGMLVWCIALPAISAFGMNNDSPLSVGEAINVLFFSLAALAWLTTRPLFLRPVVALIVFSLPSIIETTITFFRFNYW